MKYNINDFLNKTYGRLTILKENGKKGNRRAIDCMCMCGNFINTAFTFVINGYTKSCGCLQKESMSKTAIKYRKKHGDTNTRFYKIWKGINNRCNNKNNQAYNYYGGRGIKIKWLDYNDFKKDMFKSYIEHSKKFGEINTSIDRINNNGDYEFNNCKWNLPKNQCLNRRNNHYLTFKGETLTIKEWSDKLKLKYYVIFNRIKYGWDTEKILTTPVRNCK